MKILFVLANYHPYIGGAEKQAKHLAENLVKMGNSVKIVTSELPNTPNLENSFGVDVERIRVPYIGKRFLFSLTSLRKVFNESKHSDLIYTTSNYGALPAFVAAKISKRPIVITIMELLGKRWFKVESNIILATLYWLIELFVVKLPYDWRVAISKATCQDIFVAGVSKDKLGWIYLGVDDDFVLSNFPHGKLRNYLSLKASDFVYVYYGRPGITKGVEYLIEAAPMINEAMPNAHLVLILSNEPVDQYKRIGRLLTKLRNNTDSNIHIVPSFPDTRELITHLVDADCIVVPSLTEGFGLTTAEACSLGIPVIATRVGSIPEVVFGKYTLVEPASSEAIAEAVIQAAKGVYGNSTPKKNFSWRKMSMEYMEIFEKVLETSRMKKNYIA